MNGPTNGPYDGPFNGPSCGPTGSPFTDSPVPGLTRGILIRWL